MGTIYCCACLKSDVRAPGDMCATCWQKHAAEILRLRRHVSTLAALLSGVAVSAALDERAREIRDTIKKEIGE